MSRNAGRRQTCCVVVSYFDERPVDDLVQLLRRLQRDRATNAFELRVVVNSVRGVAPRLPKDLGAVRIDVRPNHGFNIGAWNHGWKACPGFDWYLFLQDDCYIRRADWLPRYRALLSRDRTGLVSESFVQWRSWQQFAAAWPEAHAQCVATGRDRGIALGASPSHAQTLALGMRADCLNAIGGFLIGDGKVEAIATEVMLSRLCIDRGYGVVQSAWKPFEYIAHPQWSALRDDARGVRWHLGRAFAATRRP